MAPVQVFLNSSVSWAFSLHSKGEGEALLSQALPFYKMGIGTDCKER